jgi:aspartyl-tRNA(Asn)/glutamyl-tRNA(Gln) amidotransferase subunit A
VKEQTAVRGLPRQSGTSFLSDQPQRADATCVARLRAAGAIVIGTTAMTEYGMSPIGQNAKRAMPKNPHDPARVAGGSSTGSAVAVATGLVPFAMGADGGGSIRIPSAMNGVFGIKPTWGRVSRAGDSSSDSVSHLGPIAAGTADLARVLELIGAPDGLDPETTYAPPIAPGSLLRALGRGVRGLRIAVDDAEWADASGPVARAGREAMRALESEGAILVPVRLELARHAPALGYLGIGLETRGILRDDWAAHADDMGQDLQVTMGVLGEVSALDYVDAQRLRNGLRLELAKMFVEVDLLALPSTVDTAALASEREMASGFVDAKVLGDVCRFMFLANLTGLPASSSPVGLDASRLPLGFQLVGDAFDEATVLAATAHLERLGVARAERPRVSVEILDR